MGTAKVYTHVRCLASKKVHFLYFSLIFLSGIAKNSFMKELSVSSANYYRLMTSCLQEPFKKLTQNITFWLDESSRGGYNTPVLGIRRKTDSWVQKGPFHRVVGLPVVFGSRGDFLQGHALYLLGARAAFFIAQKQIFLKKIVIFSHQGCCQGLLYGTRRGILSCCGYRLRWRTSRG